jgi:plasmid rolling circle replication initiator protein Rep
MCAWRRALKVFGQTSDIMGEMGRRGKYAYVFLTLTVPSVPYGSLSDCLDSLMGAWGRMSRQLAFGRAVEGWYRGVEVTRNAEAGTWHPHIHCILAVGEGYFTDARRYISRAGWLAMWRRAARDAAITQVDVRRG